MHTQKVDFFKILDQNTPLNRDKDLGIDQLHIVLSVHDVLSYDIVCSLT